MDSIESLKEALQFSPNNIPLKLILANTLAKHYRYNEAEELFLEIIDADKHHTDAKLALSKLYFQNTAYSKSIVILEDILKSKPSNFEALLLLTRVLVKENSLSDAKETYQKVIAINPRFQDEELDGMLRISNQAYFEDG
ncbi:MAG: tetratricopeptide repeat protein, partial [Bacteroidia bacterium]